MQEEYNSNCLNDIRALIYQKLTRKTLKNSKSWSEIKGVLDGTIIEDNRSAKQIEEDTLNLFKR